MNALADSRNPVAFLAAGDEMGERIRAFPWGPTSLGPPETWPQALQTLVTVMLGSNQPMFVLWGPERLLLYNDCYIEILGRKHPEALGRPFQDVWPEVRLSVGSLLDAAFGGQPAQVERMMVVLERHGYPEETYFTFAYTPVRDSDGQVVAVFCPCNEITKEVMAERRQAFISQFQERLRGLSSSQEIIEAAQDALGRHLQVSRVGYGEVEETARYFTTARNWTDGSVEHFSGVHDLAAFGPEVLAALRAGEPLVVHDVQTDPRTNSPEALAAFDHLQTAAVCTVSLVKEGRMRGALYVHNRTARRWSAEDVGIIHDVAERTWAAVERAVAEDRQHQAERRLRESEERLRIAQQAGQVGAFELFPSIGKIAVSEQFCRLWGVPVQETYDTADLVAQILPEDAGEVITTASDLPEWALRYIEYRIRRADTGEIRWMARRGQPVTGEDGRVRYFGVSYDITDRKAAEFGLQALNETLETQVAERTAERDRMWRLSTDLMLVAGFDALIQSVNPAWERQLGWKAEELIGRPFLDLVHPGDLEATVAEAGRLSQGKTTLRFENRYRHKNGSYRWLSWIAVPDIGLIHAVGRDVTAEREAAQELEQTQEALRQAQKMEAVGQLTGGIAHDFNNLLTGVIGSLDLMKRRLQQGRNEDAERFANAAASSANRAANLTQRLLAFSRRQPLNPRPVDANRLVTGMDDLLRRSLGETIRLEMVQAGGLWTTLCDPHQLESAILNLAINARDAMPSGGALTIETCNTRLDEAYAARDREIRPGQYVCICVTDTGVGIPKDVLGRVFEPFFTTKPIGQGTGLGLSMIYGFARQSDGFARIYSEEGRGTTVKIYLPRHYGPAEDEPAEPDAVHLSHDGRDEVVLVVEDEDAVRSLVVEVLSDLGYQTIEAADGVAGLRLLQSERRIDLLVTDVGLPGLNGRQLADAARAARPHLKIMFMTGYAESATVASGFLEPGMQMITKPFALDALAAQLQEMMAEA